MRLAPLLLLGGIAAAAAGEEVRVGRAALQLPGPEWKALTEYRTARKYNEYSGQQPASHDVAVENKVFVLARADGSAKALLVVSSSVSANRKSVNYQGDACPAARPKFFSDNFGSGAASDRIECLVVNAAYPSATLSRLNVEIGKAIAAHGIRFDKSGYYVRSVYGAANGTFLQVNLFTSTAFKGLAGAPAGGRDTHEVPEELVNWGNALHKAVRGSVLSFSGKVELPPLEVGD